MTAGPDPVFIALITAGGGVLAAIVGAAAAVIAAFYGKRNSQAIQEVHLRLNSRLDAFIKAARFEGQIQERDAQRGIDDAKAVIVDPTVPGTISKRE